MLISPDMCRLKHFCYLVFWLLISERNYVRCACKGSVVVFCDSITDFKHGLAINKQSWKEVIVGDPKQEPQDPRESIHYIYPEYYGRNVERLTIINQFNSSISFTNVRESLKTLTFYGNNLKKVSVTAIPYYTKEFDIVSFHHNNIENIEFFRIGPPQAIYKIQINTFDLSYNKLSTTTDYQFLQILQVNELILSNNKLTLIRHHSLPEGLKRLHLDYNRFVYFSRINLKVHDLSQLEYLTVAHNKLQAIDDFPILESLNNLDLSFNDLQLIPDVFSRCEKLRKLNLRHNKLIMFTFPNLKRDLDDVHVIDLAFNRLRDLDIKPVGNFTVEAFLFGNPWNCRCMNDLKSSKLFGNRFVERRPCDDRFADYIPYCVINNFYSEQCTGEAVSEGTLNLFLNLSKNFRDSFEETCE